MQGNGKPEEANRDSVLPAHVSWSLFNEMGITNVSTTFLTGTLTGLVSSLAKPGQGMKHGARRIGVLIGLATGALLCGLLVATAPRVVPVLPLAAVITALVLSAVPLSNGEDENPRG